MKRCPSCGSKTRLVVVKKSKRFKNETGHAYTRKIQRYECTCCDYASTPLNNSREIQIAQGLVDYEIGIINSEMSFEDVLDNIEREVRDELSRKRKQDANRLQTSLGKV